MHTGEMIDTALLHGLRRLRVVRAVHAALESGRVLQVEMRGGGGTLTVGPYTPAVGERGMFSAHWFWAGGRQDVLEELSHPEATRILLETCGTKNIIAALEREA